MADLIGNVDLKNKLASLRKRLDAGETLTHEEQVDLVNECIESEKRNEAWAEEVQREAIAASWAENEGYQS